MKLFKIITVVMLVGVEHQGKATSFILNDFDSNLYTATTTLVSSTNEIRFGFFTTGFTPTTDNFSSWLPNFTGVSGYFDGSTPEWSAGINIGDNLAYPINSRLAVIVYNILDNQSPTTATQAAIVTDTSWIVSLASGSDPTQIYYEIGANSSALVGSLVGSGADRSVTMALIPEPNTSLLLAAGLGMLGLFRRKNRGTNMIRSTSIDGSKIRSIGLVMVLLIFVLPSSYGQSTVSTPIVGFQKTTIPVGLSAIGLPLLNPDLLKSSVQSLTGTTVSFGTGISNVGSLLTAGEPYYIEVYSGSLKGDRFDIDTAATISAGNNTLILNSSSENNTFSVASIGSTLDNATIALRKHFTLSQVQTLFSTSLVANNNPSLADQINIFTSSGSFTAYYLRASPVGEWRKSGDTANYSKIPIPPGSGILVGKKTSGSELIVSGAVRQNDFALPLKAGLQYLAPSAPVDRSPVGFGMVPNTNGWVGNNNPALADQISIFENGSFVAYSLRADGTLRKSGDITNYNASQLLTGGSGFLVKRKNADANLVETQLVQE